MDLDTYRQILFLEPMKDACRELNRDWSYEKRGRYINSGDVSPLTFVKYYMGDKPPYPEEEVTHRYDEFMVQANKTRDLFENGEFARNWTQLMEQMTGEITVETRFWRFHHNHKHHYAWVEGDNAHTPETCMEIHGTVGETLFDTILKCLTEARIRIRSLHIGHCVRSRSREAFPWVFDGRLDSVDFQGLVWNPCVSPHPNLVRPVDRDLILGEVLNTLLSRSASKLRRVHLFKCTASCIYHNASEDWRETESIVKMPLIESFISEDEQFIGGLTNFFRESRHLKYIRLVYPVVKRSFHGQSSWRRFWRAIRYHPSRMVLNIQYYAGGDKLRLQHDTGKDSKSEPGSVQYSLEMYLSNRGKWNNLCEKFFGENEDMGYENMGDTDEEEMEYWEGKNDNKQWAQ